MRLQVGNAYLAHDLILVTNSHLVKPAGLAHNQPAQAYLQRQMPEEAIAELQKAIRLSGGCATCTANLARAYAESGRQGVQPLVFELPRAPGVAELETLAPKERLRERSERPGIEYREGVDLGAMASRRPLSWPGAIVAR